MRFPGAAACLVAGLLAGAAPALAGPIYVFGTSVGTQPANVGTITLTQVDTTTVDIAVDLLPGYGFLNTGGPHTPFAFTVNGSENGLVAQFLTPWTTLLGRTYAMRLTKAGGSNAPYGAFGVAIDSDAPNGSGAAYYGDLTIRLSRPEGLDTADLIGANQGGWVFSADLTNGSATGAQAWAVYTEAASAPTSVPEPRGLVLYGAGLLGLLLVAGRRRTGA